MSGGRRRAKSPMKLFPARDTIPVEDVRASKWDQQRGACLWGVARIRASIGSILFVRPLTRFQLLTILQRSMYAFVNAVRARYATYQS